MTKRKLHILVLADSRSFHTERYVRALRVQGCKVFLASLESGSMHHYTLKRRGFLKQLHYIMAATEVRTLIRRLAPDVVNPHFASGYGYTATLAGSNVPIVTNLWGSDILLVPEKSTFHRRKTMHALSHADCVVGDSQYLLDQARAMAPLRQEKIIPWGIERRLLRYRRPDLRLHRPLRIIVPRPHEKVYNNLFLVQALAPLINLGLVEIVFPEAGSLSGHFRLHARSLIGDRLRIYKRLPRSKFMAFMAQHDIYLSGALSDSSPASLIEAMGLGLLPVVADIPGVREWVAPTNGYLFEQFNAGALYSLVAGLADGDDPKVEWRRANAERVEEQAIFENNIATMIDVMEAVVARKAP